MQIQTGHLRRQGTLLITALLITAVLLGGLLSSCSRVDTVRPPLPGSWRPVAELSDEFDGTALDKAKWDTKFISLNKKVWKGREPGLFRDENVQVHKGMLHITAKNETIPGAPKRYHTYTTGIVRSYKKIKYGYFEIRARAMKSKASSAFWLHGGEYKKHLTEIDIFEISSSDEREKTLHTNAHVHMYPGIKKRLSEPKKTSVPYVLADEYHVYALEWNEHVIRWMVDGKVIREKKNVYWHQPLNLLFDSEIFKGWFGLPDVKNLPSTFSVDYIRVWQRRGGKGERMDDPIMKADRESQAN